MKIVHIKSREFREGLESGESVYIGRPMPRSDIPMVREGSIFANPYKISKSCSREEAIERYHDYLLKNPHLIELAKKKLFSKILGCHCRDPKLRWDHPDQFKPEHRCHGDIIISLLQN